MHRHVARDENHRAVFTERARKCERKSRQQGGNQGGRDHQYEGLQAARAQRRGGLLVFLVEILEHRLNRANHEWQADESKRDDHAERRVGNFYPERREVSTDPSVARVDCSESDSCHRSWQRERQIYHHVDQRFAGKLVAHEAPRHDETEYRVDQRASNRRAEAQLVSRDCPRTRDGGPELRPGQREGLEEDGRDWNQHDDSEVGERKAERQPESRQHIFTSRFRRHPLTSRLIDLVEYAAVTKKLWLRLFPSAEIGINREQRQARELVRILGGDGLVLRTEKILGDDFLSCRSVQKFQVRSRYVCCAVTTVNFIDPRDRRFCPNAQ